jgi:protein-disulfide isomerase
MKKLSHFFKTAQGKAVAGIGAIIVLLFAYYFYVMSVQAPAIGTNDITVTEADHVRGKAGAKVTLVEFGDFQCPACGAYEPIVQKVTADNKDTVQVVFRHFPLTQVHQNALLAAKVSEAASLQGKFWEMHDMLYDKQGEWSNALNARDFFLTYATNLGLDTKKFATDLNSKAIEDKIQAEYKEGVSLGVQGTPTFFVNGKKLDPNPQSIDAFNKIIQDAAK